MVRHYAGDVSYLTRGWTEKNNDALLPEVETMLQASQKPLVSSLASTAGCDAASGERFHSVGLTYLDDLESLLKTLKRCCLHYIRCFNPNDKRKAGLFNKKYVLEQVVQCGTVELVKIMHYGYPHRCQIREIVERYSHLLPKDFPALQAHAHCQRSHAGV